MSFIKQPDVYLGIVLANSQPTCLIECLIMGVKCVWMCFWHRSSQRESEVLSGFCWFPHKPSRLFPGVSSRSPPDWANAVFLFMFSHLTGGQIKTFTAYRYISTNIIRDQSFEILEFVVLWKHENICNFQDS